VILEGELRKKRANKVMKWRKKYYVLSRTYGALFFWTGSRGRVEGVIKKVRYETFLSVKHFPNKSDGRRFELRVVTGRTMQLLASSAAEAKKWVETLHSVLGNSMSAIRIQACYRGYRARKALKKVRTERSRAVARVAGAGGTAGGTAGPGGAGGAGAGAGGKGGSTVNAAASQLAPVLAPAHAQKVHGAIKATGGGRDAAHITMSADGIRFEGELRKKNSSLMHSLLQSYRTRYFVLHAGDAQLYYFESKAQRTVGVKPRAIPVITFYHVSHMLDKKGQKSKGFVLKVVSGRSFLFETKTVDEAGKWVGHLLAVLPRDNAAAIKIQSAARRMLAVKKLRQLKREAADKVLQIARKYNVTPERAQHCAGVLQRYMRMAVARRKWVRAQRARHEAEQKALEAAAAANPRMSNRNLGAAPPKPEWLAFKKAGAHAPPAGAAPPAGGPMPSGTAGRLAKLRELKALKDAAAAASSASTPSTSEWAKFHDDATGRDYWYNATTGDTTWTNPEEAGGSAADWEEMFDEASGRNYFYNKVTGESSWTKPGEGADGTAATASGAVKPRPGAMRWIERKDPATDRTFYACVDDGSTSWTPPEGLADGSARLVQSDWFSKVDPGTGRRYYVHSVSGETQWDRPTSGYDSGDEEDAGTSNNGLPEGWIAITDPASGREYYLHSATGERTWNKPGSAAQGLVVQDLVTGKAEASAASAASGSAASPQTNASSRRLQRQQSTRAAAVAAATASSTRNLLGGSFESSHVLHKPAAAQEEGVYVDAHGDSWRALVDPKTNRTYWWNARTGESSWTRPGHEQEDSDNAHAAAGDPNEALTFSYFINEMLAPDSGAHIGEGDIIHGRVPLAMDAQPPAVFEASKDGILLSRLVAAFAPESLDVRVIDPSAAGDLSVPAVFTAAKDNCQLAISAAQSAGCVFTKDVTPVALASGNHLAVLDFVWQCFKSYIIQTVTVRGGVPGITRLAAEGESLEDLVTLPSEELLLRWLNFQLEAAAHNGSHAYAPTGEFGHTLSDGVKLCALMRTVCPSACDAVPASDDAAREAGATAAITAALSAAFAAGVPAWFSVEGIAQGNIRLQLAFCAYLFKVAPNMSFASTSSSGTGATISRQGAIQAGARGAKSKTAAPRVSENEAAAFERQLASQMSKDADGDNSAASREARTACQWINALDIEGVYVRQASMAADVRDGVMLLKILELVEPGIVNWSKVNMRPANRYKMVENCNLIITLGKAMDFHLVNVGGLDFVDGNVKLLLAFLQQLMRYHTLKMLSRMAFDGFATDDQEILAWANERVSSAASSMGSDPDAVRIRSFNDPALSSGIYLLYLLAALRPGSVQWNLVSDGSSREDHEGNVRYVLSLARRLGAAVFIAPEDVVDVKSRPILLLVASIMTVDTKQRQGEAGFAGDNDEEIDVDSDDE
jgi:plastin-1